MRSQLVLIEWNDAAAATTAWQHEVTTVACQTMGFLVAKNKKEVVIAHTMAADGDFVGKFAIPRGFIKVIKIMK